MASILLLIAICCTGCGGTVEAEQEQAAYICNQTKQVFAASEVQNSNVNPKTGKSTLVRGMYCVKCDRWHPGPPKEAMANRAVQPTCPIHKTPLKSVGPIPLAAAE